MVENFKLMIYKLLFKLGSLIRNPSKNKHLIFLEKSNNWSSKKLEDYQLKKLKELLEFAYENSSFYKSHFICWVNS